MSDRLVKVAKTSDLADGQMMMVMAGEEEILLARVDGNYYAIGNVCSHMEGWLDGGELLPDTLEVECPLHQGHFDLRTGEPTREPPLLRVPTYAVRIEGDDILVGPRPS